MTTEQKIIRAKVRLLELAKQARQRQPSLQDNGLQPLSRKRSTKVLVTHVLAR
jgi:hypothetical protein